MCLQGAHTPEQASQLHLQPAALCCVPLAGVDHKHGVGGQAIIDGPQLAVCCGEDGPEAILTKVHAWPGHLQSVIVFWCQHRVWNSMHTVQPHIVGITASPTRRQAYMHSNNECLLESTKDMATCSCRVLQLRQPEPLQAAQSRTSSAAGCR